MKNVYYNPIYENYQIKKTINGKTITYGTYKNEEDAILIRNELEKENWDKDKLLDIQKNLFGEILSKTIFWKTLNN